MRTVPAVRQLRDHDLGSTPLDTSARHELVIDHLPDVGLRIADRPPLGERLGQRRLHQVFGRVPIAGQGVRRPQQRVRAPGDEVTELVLGGYLHRDTSFTGYHALERGSIAPFTYRCSNETTAGP